MRPTITRGGALLAIASLLALTPLSAAGMGVAAGAGVPVASGDVPGGQDADAASEEPDPLFDDDFFDLDAPGVYDPFETGNRAIFGFNQQVDRFVWTPITDGYRFLVPEPARRGVRRFFGNLNTPVFVVNHILQLRFLNAGETLGAFVFNSTFGLAGFLDAAGRVGLDRMPADFGQTLALVGVGAGPYLVIPFIGPSTVRDGFGSLVDRMFHPFTYVLGLYPQLMLGGGVGVSRLEAAADKLEALEESAVDFYAVLRSAYWQAREESIDECRRMRRRGFGDEDGAALGWLESPKVARGAGLTH
jgi:phospholipid-binding lipoprotein MlaA